MNSPRDAPCGVQAGRRDRGDAAGIGQEQHDVLGPALRGQQGGREQDRDEHLLHARQYRRRAGGDAAIIEGHAPRCSPSLLAPASTPALAGRPPPPSGSCRPMAASWPPGSSWTSASRPPATGGRRPRACGCWVDGVEWTLAQRPARPGGAAGRHHQLPVARASAAARPGRCVIRATTADGASAESRLQRRGLGRAGAAAAARAPATSSCSSATAWARRIARRRASSRAARTTARPPGRLAMDTLEVTGQVMTGVAQRRRSPTRRRAWPSYVTGQKNANNQEGVFPDNTADFFDNPRIEYLGEMLRRTRGAGLQRRHRHHRRPDRLDAGGQRRAHLEPLRGPGHRRAVLRRAQDQRRDRADGRRREPLLGRRRAGGTRPDDRNLARGVRAAPATRRSATAPTCGPCSTPSRPAPKAILGLFHQSHMVVAFDKVGAGRYSDELALEKNAAYRDTPMLEDMTKAGAQVAVGALAGRLLPDGRRRLDRQAGARRRSGTRRSGTPSSSIARWPWPSSSPRRTNSDSNPDNDTLVIVTADHECGGMAIIGVGNEHYVPSTHGQGRARLRRRVPLPARTGAALHPQLRRRRTRLPRRSEPVAQAAARLGGGPGSLRELDRRSRADRGRRPREEGRRTAGGGGQSGAGRRRATSPASSSPAPSRTARRACPDPQGCPADTASNGHTFAGHTATDVPLSATGPARGSSRASTRTPTCC